MSTPVQTSADAVRLLDEQLTTITRGQRALADASALKMPKRELAIVAAARLRDHLAGSLDLDQPEPPNPRSLSYAQDLAAELGEGLPVISTEAVLDAHIQILWLDRKSVV